MRLIFVFLTIVFCALPIMAAELTIHTKTGDVKFEVKIAETPGKAAVGLMNVYSMPDNEGMLFSLPKDQVWNMWMKNTYIPLDMIFFSREGVIMKIIENVPPHDLTPRSSDIPVAGVVELNAGIARRHNIQVGQTITLNYPIDFGGPYGELFFIRGRDDTKLY